jgi:flagella basal body P-ring formation protein FlgA
MDNIHKLTSCLLAAAGLLSVAAQPGLGIEPRGTPMNRITKSPVVIAIRPAVDVESRVICLGDIATITCSDAYLRERLKKLDLEDALSLNESVTITDSQIRFRLQVAGMEIDRISIRGNVAEVTARQPRHHQDRGVVQGVATTATSAETTKQVNATMSSEAKSNQVPDQNNALSAENSIEREVIQAAKFCVLNRLPWPDDAVDIRLAQPLPASVRQISFADGYELTTDLRSAGAPVGRVHVRVIAEAQQRPTFELPVVLEVRHFDKVVVTARPLERGHVITADDLHIDRQDVTELTEYSSDQTPLIGMSLKRSIRALQPLRTIDLEVATRTESSVLVKRREQVKMVARIGSVSVEAIGEALQDGRLGETIRLRNIESNANIQGRVTKAGEVEIKF